jgi:proteasome alpha subunit
VRHADTKGYAYSRHDVEARSLANIYAQYLGQVFTHEMKPMEVEILVAELGAKVEESQLYHILYDGTVVDETSYCVLGGDAESVIARFATSFDSSWSLEEAVTASVAALAGADRVLSATDLEVAVLSLGNGRRTFTRISQERLKEILSAEKE